MSEQTEAPKTPVSAKVSTSKPQHIWNILANPIFMMGVRTRLRPKQAMAWSVVTFIVTAFVFFVVYLTAKERGIAPAIGAKGAIVPILFIQGVILMLLGTGHVASGIAFDRDKGTLNFQRMTPMSPISKILGYLFGLPVRQYLMFLTTMPFLIAAVLISGISVWKILHFYLVFFTTTWLYHMLGMVSGMITPAPRRASWIAQVAIVLVYISMPTLSELGFTFLGFITVLPTFQGILMSEVATYSGAISKLGNPALLQQPWSDLQFFNISIHPTTYTLLVQGMFLLTCFVVVSRKWHREENHALPKGYALGFFVWMQVFLLGSLWPYLSSQSKLLKVAKKIGKMSPDMYNNLILYIFFFLAGTIGLWLLYIIAPSWFTYIKGLRRARKLKTTRIPFWSDASTGFWYALAFVGATSLSYFLLLRLISGQGRTFSNPPSFGRSIALPLLFAGFLIGMQGLRELLEKRGFLFLLFFLWILPAFLGIIMMSAFREFIPAAYLTTITPMMSFVYALQYLHLDWVTRTMAGKYVGHIPTLAWLSVCLHWGVALTSMWLLWKKKQHVRQEDVRQSTHRTAERLAWPGKSSTAALSETPAEQASS